MHRSLSNASIERGPALAPERVARIELEQYLNHVWTHEKLSYPAMSAVRTTPSFRSSASQVMRKLSKASIGSKASTVTTSVTSHGEAREENTAIDEDPFVDRRTMKQRETATAPTVDRSPLAEEGNTATGDNNNPGTRSVVRDHGEDLLDEPPSIPSHYEREKVLEKVLKEAESSKESLAKALLKKCSTVFFPQQSRRPSS